MKWACRRPAKCDGANFPLFRLGTILGLGSSFQITRNTKKRGNMYTHNQLVSYPFMALSLSCEFSLGLRNRPR